MVREFPNGSVPLDSTWLNIARIPLEQLALLNLDKETWQQQLLPWQKQQKNCSYCLISYKDSLTRLANRRYFSIYLEQQWKTLAQERTSLSLILLEIDYFKLYNKTRGYEAAEECLQQVAKAVVDCVDCTNSLVARYEEEKFSIILPKTKASTTLKIAEKIRNTIKKLALLHDPGIDGLPDRVVTVSLGVASTIPDVEAAPSLLVRAADEALYQAKRKGRDRTEVKCIAASSL